MYYQIIAQLYLTNFIQVIKKTRMKSFTLLITLITYLTLSAQQENSSLQASLNKALKADQSKNYNFEANVDLSLNAVQLKWRNVKESNVSSFVVERSIDKIEWEEVATIFGASHNSQLTDFFYLDYKPTENLTYYRLRATRNNGKERFSNIVPINYLKKEGATAGMNLHPDFSEDYKIVNIAFEEIFEKEILVVLRDKKGNEFYSKIVINVEDEVLVAVPIESVIPKGEYLITATSENQIYSQNVTVL